MTTKNIDSTIYAVLPDHITKYRYNPLLGIVLTLLSIGMLWANGNLAWFDQHEIVAQWNLLFASCILCTGLTMICYRLFGDSSAPIDRKTRERLYRVELGFDALDYNKVKMAFDEGDFVRLRTMPHGYNPAIKVVCYRTDSGSLMAAQVIGHDQADGDIRLFRHGEYSF